MRHREGRGEVEVRRGKKKGVRGVLQQCLYSFVFAAVAVAVVVRKKKGSEQMKKKKEKKKEEGEGERGGERDGERMTATSMLMRHIPQRCDRCSQ